jgi:hypothetical protein
MIVGMLALSACATAGSGDSSPTDGGAKDGTTADAKADGPVGCPTGYTGAGCKDCAGGFHMCSSSCEQDHANSPDAGCSLGCGATTCDAPQYASAKCTSDGHCDFACDTSFDKVGDAGCECPSGQMVCNGNVCQQCCVDTDCVGNQVCNGGVCAGCQPGYGDCNNNLGDGCETHLNTTSNCGSCGHGCCGSFCGCGFLGFGGENCNANGNSFSCGC